jgi:hypothetical protein
MLPRLETKIELPSESRKRLRPIAPQNAELYKIGWRDKKNVDFFLKLYTLTGGGAS